MSSEETVLRDAEFNPQLRTYWMVIFSITLLATVVGIVLIPFVFIVGPPFIAQYMSRMRCTLTDRSLRVERGLLVRVQKTVPLDKITDLGMVQGPIMRHFGIEAMSIETAGQSSQGALVRMPGIVDARSFREAVIRQRDLVVESMKAESGAAPSAPGAELEVLIEIRDALGRIESRLPVD